MTLKSASNRKLKNSVAKWLITFGGISVLFTLVLIFLYLLYVIKPVFESAHIEQVTQIELTESAKVLDTGVDELKELAYSIDDSGTIRFYQLVASANHQVGELVLQQSVSINEAPLGYVVNGEQERKLIVNNQGGVIMIKPQFKAHFEQGVREIVPSVKYPLGEDALPLDEQEASFTELAFAMRDELAVFVGYSEDHRLLKTTFIAEDDFNYDPAFEAVYQEVDLPNSNATVKQVLITPDGAMAFVQADNIVYVFDLADEDSVPLKAEIRLDNPNIDITTMALLPGSSSVLIADTTGKISQWFEVAGEHGRQFQKIRDFDVSNNDVVAHIHTEQFRKSFYTVTEKGDVGVFYTTSEADLWRGKLADNAPQTLAISPRADAVIAIENNMLTLFSVENEHPEVTWSALWQEVWYEGYPEPGYIWQSTGGADDFESKFSLMPISFGTLKAAMYAMLFAVPIALSAAIYTAYFMTPGLRKKVKPTIELMEALPTVILGFLAGLWLAPIIEDYLPAIFMLLIVLPLTVFITAFAWHKLPRDIKNRIPETWAPIILIPALLIAGYGAFACSPAVEAIFFGGDIRQFITNEMGIDFDQRNALVVGIAMGFAVIPTIFSMAEDAIFSVPKHLTSGSLALGATQWQTLVKVVLLTASPGIFSAVMMGLGRAVGETMIVLMATGNTPVLDWSIFQGMRTLSANIAVEMPESEVGSSHYRILFLAAFVLFVFTFIFNTCAEFIRQRLRDKYSSL